MTTETLANMRQYNQVANWMAETNKDNGWAEFKTSSDGCKGQFQTWGMNAQRATETWGVQWEIRNQVLLELKVYLGSKRKQNYIHTLGVNIKPEKKLSDVIQTPSF